MRTAKAGSGWQQDQEDHVWQLVMKEDGRRPVRTRSNDGTHLVGRRGSATAVLGSSPRTPSTKTTFDGRVGWVHSMMAVALDGGSDGQQRGHVEAAGAKRGGCRQQTQQSVVSRLDMYRTKVLMYRAMVLLACLTKVRC